MARAVAGASPPSRGIVGLFRRRRMKRRVLFAVLLAISLAIVALLPLYVERTMTELMFADGTGGAIEWGWKRCTLRDYYADYHHMDREQKPAVWLAVNVGLAVVYASVVALGFTLITRRTPDKT